LRWREPGRAGEQETTGRQPGSRINGDIKARLIPTAFVGLKPWKSTHHFWQRFTKSGELEAGSSTGGSPPLPESECARAMITTNRCCALKRNNHDGTKEKGCFVC